MSTIFAPIWPIRKGKGVDFSKLVSFLLILRERAIEYNPLIYIRFIVGIVFFGGEPDSLYIQILQ